MTLDLELLTRSGITYNRVKGSAVVSEARNPYLLDLTSSGLCGLH